MSSFFRSATFCRRRNLLHALGPRRWVSSNVKKENPKRPSRSRKAKDGALDETYRPARSSKAKEDTELESTGEAKTRKKRNRSRTSKIDDGEQTDKAGEVLPEVVGGWDLPPLDLWRKYFPLEKASIRRCVVRKPETAAMLAEALVPEGSKDKIIIDACPGPGQLTRALLKLPRERIKKLIVLESARSYLKFLKPLEKMDSRVKVYQRHGKEWEAYTSLRESGAFDDIKQVDWNEVHPQLQFIMHMHTSVEGEQLLSQFFRCIPDRQWLFHYGRVPLNLILSTRIRERVVAPIGNMARCKLSVIGQATVEVQQFLNPEALEPYSEHFHPDLVYNVITPSGRGPHFLEPRRLGTSHMAITALPLVNQYIRKGDLDMWDYVLRKMFVLKATSLKKCLNANALGPGSSNLIPKLVDRSRGPGNFLDVLKGPRELTLREWDVIVQAFKEWPFRPEDLGIDAFFEVNSHNR